MEREQIIKALECCIKTQCDNCCNLGNWHEQWNCMTDLMKKALALIKELTEENARLRNWCENKIVLDDDELKEVKTACLERIKLDVKGIKADTVRKFAKTLKEGFRKYDRANWAVRAIIDEIAKEMMEGE